MSPKKKEREITIKDKTLAEVGIILGKHVLREDDPVTLVMFWEWECITGFLQLMRKTAKGKRLPILHNRATFEVFTEGSDVKIAFRRGRFPKPELLWQAVSNLVALLKRDGLEVLEDLTLSSTPPNPAIAGWDATFDWYYNWQRVNNQRMTTKDLANKINYSHVRVRQMKANYDAEHKP